MTLTGSTQISPGKSKLTSVLTVPQDINLEQLIRLIFAGFLTKMLMFQGDPRGGGRGRGRKGLLKMTDE